LPNRVPKEVTAERERRAWELRQQCWTEERIAAELDIAQSTVSVILRRVEKRFAQQFVSLAEQVKASQSAQLEHIAFEAMQAWERSKLNAETRRTVTEQVSLKGEEETLDDEGLPIRRKKAVVPAVKETTTFTSEGQCGDPRMLEKAINALADIRSIWGLDAPKKTDVTSGGEAVGVIGYRIAPPQETNEGDAGTGDEAPERGD
jgi:hypothetical protein